MSFNKTHPELQEGEAFLMNTSSVERAEEIQHKFKTVRMGNIAYDTNGNISQDLKPFFISKEELKEHGVPNDSEWSEMIGILFNRDELTQTKGDWM